MEDTLQRSTDPEDITGVIAASAIRTQHPTVLNMPEAMVLNDERNVFAIYVSYYVKVKLTLSGIGGELSLKLPFALVHIDQLPNEAEAAGGGTVAAAATDDAININPANPTSTTDSNNKLCDTFSTNLLLEPPKNRTKSAGDESAVANPKRKLVRSSTTIKDSSEDEEIEVPIQKQQPLKSKTLSKSASSDSEVEPATGKLLATTCVQIHSYSSSNLKGRGTSMLSTTGEEEDSCDSDEGACGVQEVNEEKDEIKGDDNELSKYS